MKQINFLELSKKTTKIGRHYICCLKLVHPAGFEPATFGTGNQRSIQLSYGCVLHRPR